MPYPEIPAEIRHELDNLRVEAAAAFQLHYWEDAANRLQTVFVFLMQQQERYNRRFHKGWELHNRGIALLNVPRFDDGVRSIGLAYVEDVVSADPGSEDVADRGLAGSMLHGFEVSSAMIEAIKKVAARHKRAGYAPFDPTEVLAEAMAEVGAVAKAGVPRGGIRGRAPIGEAPPKKRRIEEIETPYQLRCFIGGSYFYGGPNLTAIQKIIASEGFDAIIPDLFEMEADDIHHRCLLLLQLCPKAVFEVTAPGGQFMELERCRDYGIKPLLVRHIRPDGVADQMVSEMVRTMVGVDEVHPYDETDELKPIIQAYLHGG